MKLGVGYVFGAADKGVRKMFGRVRAGVGSVNDSLRDATSGAGSLRDTLLAVSAVQLGAIRSGVDSLKAGVGEIASSGIDTRMESMFTSFDQSFASSAARAGILGSELRDLESEVFSVAFAMNRSAEDVGANMIALERAGLSLDSVLGVGGTMADYQKVLEATGMSAQAYTATFNDLTKSWGFDDAGARSFFDTFTAQTVALGTSEEAFAALPGMMGEIDKAFAHLDNMTPEDIQRSILGIAQMGAGLQEALGEDPQASMEKSMAMFAAIAGEARSFDMMMAGMGGSFGDLSREMAMMGGDMSGALAELQAGATDPVKFMSTLGTMFQRLDDDGSEAANTMKTRLLSSLQQVDPAFAFLAQGGGNVSTMFQGLSETANAGTTSLVELGEEGYRSGLTLSESMDRARMSMEQAFGGATRADRQKFATMMIGNYGLIGDTIRNLTGSSDANAAAWREQAGAMGLSASSADKLRGPLGTLVSYMGVLSSTGVHGAMVKLLGEDSVLAGGLGVIAEGLMDVLPSLAMFAPALAILLPVLGTVAAGAAGLATQLAPVLIPLGLLVAGAGAVYLAFTGQLGDAFDFVKTKAEDAFMWLAGQGSTLLDRVANWFAGIDGAALAHSAVGFVRSTLMAVIDGFKVDLSANPEVQSAGAKLISSLLSAGRQAWPVIQEFSSELVSMAGESLAANGPKIVPYMQDMLSRAWSALTSAQSDSDNAMLGLFDSIDWESMLTKAGDGLLDVRHIMADKLVDFFGMASEWVSDVDWENMGESVGVAIAGQFGRQGKMTAKLGAFVSDFFENLITTGWEVVTTKQFWMDSASTMWSALKFAFAVRSGIDQFFMGVFKGLAETGVNALFGEGTWDAGFDYLFNKVDQVKGWFTGLWSSIRDGAFALFGNSINTFVEHDFGIIESIVEKAKGWFLSLSDVATSVFASIMDTIKMGLRGVRQVASTIGAAAERLGFSGGMFSIEDSSGTGETANVVDSMRRPSDASMAATLIDQHARDREILRDILTTLRAPATQSGNGRIGSQPVSSLPPN